MARVEPEKRDEMDFMLNVPMPGRGRGPKQTAESIAADTAAFLSAAGL